jgi:hypothetical protein
VRAAQAESGAVVATAPAANQAAPPASGLPETRPVNLHHVLLIGCVAGVVVLGLIYLQVREMRRRRKAL